MSGGNAPKPSGDKLVEIAGMALDELAPDAQPASRAPSTERAARPRKTGGPKQASTNDEAALEARLAEMRRKPSNRKHHHSFRASTEALILLKLTARALGVSEAEVVERAIKELAKREGVELDDA